MEKPAAPASAIQSLPVHQLKPNPWNRTVFDPEAMEDLVVSIKSDGIKEPLIVRKVSDAQYEIASGNRRWLAAQKAGLEQVPCLVRDLPDVEVAEDNITLNIQRENIQPLELVRMVKAYMDQFHKNQKEAAEDFGKDKTWVSHLLSFLDIPVEVREKLKAFNLGWIPLRALRASSLEIQLQIIQELNNGGLRAERIEKRCNQLRFSGKKQVGTSQTSDPDPLHQIWQSLLSKQVEDDCEWGVSYRGDAWHFRVAHESMEPRWQLKAWFLKMAEAMGDTEKEEADLKAGLEVGKAMAEGRYDELMDNSLEEIARSMPPEDAAKFRELMKSDSGGGTRDDGEGHSLRTPSSTPRTPPPASPAPNSKKPLDPKIAAMIERQRAKGKIL